MGGKKGPGSYSDIGRAAKDLLTKDFNYEQKFTVTSKTKTDVTFTHVGVKKGEELSGDVKADFKYQNVKTEVKVDSKSRLHGTFTVDDAMPGLRVILKGSLPDQKSAKAEAHYTTEYLHATSVVGLAAKPLLEGTVAVGHQGMVVGAEGTFDTATNTTTKYNFAVGLVKDDFAAAVQLTDKADTLKASYIHTLNPTATVAVEIAHKFAKSDITFTTGASYKLDPQTLTKVRLNNRGTISALLQHEFRPKSTFTVSGEVDSKAPDKTAKFGFALNIKP
eukprot:TRINITY_DN35809_c0_g1_i1.p1 TRINITY_DN35809_c0_g1~~TRINITY_DN35809_c0_g1_i1.p1  ORF type:complete len:277 (+),score=58.05 TRINITY_DN35809_c0_g1_i1:123-953(+)